MAQHMTKFGIATLAGAAMSAVVIGLAAPAVAAPSGPGDARNTTIDSLGYKVDANPNGPIDAIQRD
ncbi:hypothetical protein ACXDF8_17160 [Mycolicibacterium sp. CBM1]